MKYTFLSKWTVLIMTVLTIGLTVLGVGLVGGSYSALGQHVPFGLLAIIVGLLIYFVAWIIALVDSIQEKRYGWTVAVFLLGAVGLAPIVYSLFGPKNTK